MMKKAQAAGYIFEDVLWELLRATGYVQVTSGKISGRGADHQIDAYGTFSIPTPFIYPIRLLAEAKCRKGSTGLPEIRSFLSVITDIEQNYPSSGQSSLTRFSHSGCFFSSSAFTKDAESFAWAHNIFLVTFSEVKRLVKLCEVIQAYVGSRNYSTMRRRTKVSVVEGFRGWLTTLPVNDVTYLTDTALLVGTLDEKYPVVLSTNKDIINALQREMSNESDVVGGVKTQRKDTGRSSIFTINVLGIDAQFAIPDYIAAHIIKQVESSVIGDHIFNIDLPIVRDLGEGNFLRRVLRLKIKLETPANNRAYLEHVSEVRKNLDAT
jgi:hypothetical protein